MNIVVKRALASGAIAFAYACATPVELDDILIANPNDFDAGLGGTAGDMGQSGASPGGTGAGTAGASSGTGGTGPAGITGTPVGLSGAGGLPTAAGAGGVGAGGAGDVGAGGAGGAAAAGGGSGGAAGAATGAAGTAGTAGAGGTGSGAVFDASSCDFNDTTGCDTLACQARCPTNDGNSCLNRCVPIVTCVSDDVSANPDAPCPTLADPMCGQRAAGNGAENTCTSVVEPAGGFNPAPPAGAGNPSPAFVARQFIECICSIPRP